MIRHRRSESISVESEIGVIDTEDLESNQIESMATEVANGCVRITPCPQLRDISHPQAAWRNTISASRVARGLISPTRNQDSVPPPGKIPGSHSMSLKSALRLDD
jgi:hypothetical protein